MTPAEWAYNTLTISTVSTDNTEWPELSEIQEELEDLDDMSPLTFYEHCPIPDVLIETIGSNEPEWLAENRKLCGYSTVHEFCLKEWGCVMDATEVSFIQPDNHTLVYEFKTRSKPPMAWIKSISSQYPSLMFEIDCINEMELWDEYEAVYINGQEVVHHFKKHQR